MITIELGKTFCNWYNRESNTNLTPCEIFRTVIAPTLFENDKHLVMWSNSKFWGWRYLNKTKWLISDFQNVLNDFCEEVESNKGGLADSLKVFGGCAVPYDTQSKKYKVEPQTTTFCYCENLNFNIDERYCSWIGSAFLMGFNDFSIAINDEEYIKTMFSSIKDYRKALSENPDINGGNLGGWNTLYFYCHYKYGRTDNIIEKYYTEKGLKRDFSFEHILFVISKYLPNIKYIEIEKFGKTNTTCGTIFVNNKYVNRMADILEHIYKDVNNNADFSKFDFSKTFGGKNVLYKAIESGSIYEGFFDPLNDVKFDKLNKNNLLFKYIETVMSENDKTLANDFVNTVKEKIKKDGKYRKNIYFEISPYRNVFINNITALQSEVGCDVAFDKMVDYAISCISDSEFKLMSSYLKFLYNK